MIENYIERFKKLRSDRNAQWPATSLYRSPYKPLLLLSVMDLFAEGSITDNLIQITPDLGELFSLYCSLVMPTDQRNNMAMPFFHLSREGFWQLVPLPGKENIIASQRRLQSINLLVETVKGARFDDELYALLCVEKSRNLLRTVLIETYFAPEVQPKLIEQGVINFQAFTYSQKLLEQAKKYSIKEAKVEEIYQIPARDQGFRRAIVTAYDHRCALCGIRILTPDGRTAVVGAHIVPWSITHNDDPRNGISLCYLCHWAFDEGLIGVLLSYVVTISPRLIGNNNLPGHLATYDGRGMIGPSDQTLWPEPESLSWHLREVFRKK